MAEAIAESVTAIGLAVLMAEVHFRVLAGMHVDRIESRLEEITDHWPDLISSVHRLLGETLRRMQNDSALWPSEDADSKEFVEYVAAHESATLVVGLLEGAALVDDGVSCLKTMQDYANAWSIALAVLTLMPLMGYAFGYDAGTVLGVTVAMLVFTLIIQLILFLVAAGKLKRVRELDSNLRKYLR